MPWLIIRVSMYVYLPSVLTILTKCYSPSGRLPQGKCLPLCQHTKAESTTEEGNKSSAAGGVTSHVMAPGPINAALPHACRSPLKLQRFCPVALSRVKTRMRWTARHRPVMGVGYTSPRPLGSVPGGQVEFEGRVLTGVSVPNHHQLGTASSSEGGGGLWSTTSSPGGRFVEWQDDYKTRRMLMLRLMHLDPAAPWPWETCRSGLSRKAKADLHLLSKTARILWNANSGP